MNPEPALGNDARHRRALAAAGEDQGGRRGRRHLHQADGRRGRAAPRIHPGQFAQRQCRRVGVLWRSMARRDRSRRRHSAPAILQFRARSREALSRIGGATHVPPIQYIVEAATAEGRDRARRQQERRAADHRGRPSHRASGHARQRAADPRHRNAGGTDPLGRRVGRMARTQPARDPRQGHSRRRSRSRSVRAHPRLDPARGSAAGALRRGGAAAARRRRHRPAPARHAFPRLRAARRHRGRHRPAGIPLHRAARRRRLPRRAQRHRDRERAGRGRRRRGRHPSAQCRLRAACAGPRAFPGRARRADRGHRHQHDDRARAGDAGLGELFDPARPYRGRLADRAWPR